MSSELSAPIFQIFKLLQIKEIYTCSIDIFIYKHARHTHPRILDSMFIKNNEVHISQAHSRYF